MVCSPEGDKFGLLEASVAALLEGCSTDVELLRVLEVRFPLLLAGSAEEVEERLVSCGWTDAEAAILVSCSIGGAEMSPLLMVCSIMPKCGVPLLICSNAPRDVAVLVVCSC